MKKLGLIIIMALVLTVGGVYATFNYAQHDVATVNKTLDKTIADAEVTTPKGTIAIDAGSFELKIDDITATLKTGLTTSGNVKVTFTPAQGADASVVADGVELKLEIAFANNKYTQNTVDYTVFETTIAYGTGVPLGKGTRNDATGAFEYTVNLGQYLAVNEIPLPTLADYNAFEAWFTNPANASITVTVSEVK